MAKKKSITPPPSLNFKPSTIWTGDNLHTMRGLNTDSVDMIYLDPPFNSNRSYGDPLGGNVGFKDVWTMQDIDYMEHGEVAEHSPAAYKVIDAAGAAQGKGTQGYLIFMAARLIELERILKTDTGHIFLHCDDTAGHWLKALMDAIFGKDAFSAHINWKRSNPKNNATKAFGREVDFILHYAREKSKFYAGYVPLDQKYEDQRYKHNDENGRGPYRLNPLTGKKQGGCFYDWKGYQCPPRGWVCTEATMQRYHDEGRLRYPTYKDGTPAYHRRIEKKQYLSESKGRPIGNLWLDIPPVNGMASQNVDFDTQKPRELLERIIACTTKQNDLIFDPFCGCATTLVTADSMGRNWIGCDVSPLAVEKLRERLTKDEKKGGKKNTDAVKPLVSTNVIVVDVRDKDMEGRKLRRKDPLPQRTDTGERYNYRDKRQELYGKQDGYCFGCWTPREIKLLEIDHMNPRDKGGQDVDGNLQLLCSPCNKSKHNKSMSEWEAWKKKKHPELFDAEKIRRLEYEAVYGLN